MSGFDERKDAFEKKFAHDEELLFRAEARCCRLFGAWLAGEMGLAGAEAEAYAKDVIGSNLEEPGFADVKRKVMPDIAAKGLDISERQVDAKLAEFLAEAKRQVAADQK
jgi:hypothetical protein